MIDKIVAIWPILMIIFAVILSSVSLIVSIVQNEKRKKEIGE